MKKILILFLLLAPLVCWFAPAQSFDLSTGRIPLATAAQAFGQEDEITVLTVRSVPA